MAAAVTAVVATVAVATAMVATAAAATAAAATAATATPEFRSAQVSRAPQLRLVCLLRSAFHLRHAFQPQTVQCHHLCLVIQFQLAATNR